MTGDWFIWAIVGLNAMAAVGYLKSGDSAKGIMAACASIMNGAFIFLK